VDAVGVFEMVLTSKKSGSTKLHINTPEMGGGANTKAVIDHKQLKK
jgi:hypothetical protein